MSFECATPRVSAVSDQRDVDLVEKTLRSALENPAFRFWPVLKNARDASRRHIAAGGRIPNPNRDRQQGPCELQPDSNRSSRTDSDCSTTFILSRPGGISIALSRISTQAGAAIDTFYVVDRANHSKVTDPQRIAAMQKSVAIDVF